VELIIVMILIMVETLRIVMVVIMAETLRIVVETWTECVWLGAECGCVWLRALTRG
jgi:hypothetical protein